MRPWKKSEAHLEELMTDFCHHFSVSATCFTGEVEVGFDTDGNIEFTKGRRLETAAGAGLSDHPVAPS
jgi:hypothetical protein